LTASSTVRVAMIGAGRIGRLHVANLVHPEIPAEVVGVVDIELVAAERLAGELGIAQGFSDIGPLLASQRPDAVVICTPAAQHGEAILAAAAAGVHVFCEKPLDFELDRIDEVLRAVERAGIKLQVGFNRRFDPDFARLYHVIGEGGVGQPELVRITSRDPTPPPLSYIKTSGGLFLDMAIHDFDMARFLIGHEVVKLYSTGSALVDSKIAEAGDVDTAVTVLEFSGGAIATIDNSRRAVYGYDQRVEVLGSLGMVHVNNRPTDTCRVSTAGGELAAGPTDSTLGRYERAYFEELRVFIECVRNETPVPVSGYDGRQATLLALAATQSARDGRAISIADFDRAS